MASSIAMMLGGALANALAFTGSSYLFSSLSRGDLAKERKRHDLAVEQLTRAQIQWNRKRQERIDFINKQFRAERRAEAKFTELNDAMQKYHEVFGKELNPLPPKPVLSDFYHPSENQHFREIAFITLSMVMIGGVVWYYEK